MFLTIRGVCETRRIKGWMSCIFNVITFFPCQQMAVQGYQKRSLPVGLAVYISHFHMHIYTYYTTTKNAHGAPPMPVRPRVCVNTRFTEQLHLNMRSAEVCVKRHLIYSGRHSTPLGASAGITQGGNIQTRVFCVLQHLDGDGHVLLISAATICHTQKKIQGK